MTLGVHSDSNPAALTIGGLDRNGRPRCLQPFRFSRWAESLVEALLFFVVYLIVKWGGWWGILWVSELLVFCVVEYVRWRFFSRYRRELLARVVRNDLHACLQCGYLLTGLPEAHCCPECGTQFNLAQTRAAWERLFSSDSRGLIGRERRDMLLQNLEQIKRAGARRFCIRCGERLPEKGPRDCPACGAANVGPPSNLLVDLDESDL